MEDCLFGAVPKARAGLTLLWLTPSIRQIFESGRRTIRSAYGSMFRMVFLQFGATIVATAIAAVFFGLRGSISAALGGLACVLPTGLFALRLHWLARRRDAPHVTAFFVGEFIKIASIVGLLASVRLLYEDVHWGALFIGLVLALKANLFAFLVKN